MYRYIALLRGINVGGHRKVLMADLRKLLDALGYKNVRSYLQSGNVIFDTAQEQDENTLAQEIETSISKAYHFDVPVMVCTKEEWRDIVEQNPYYQEEADDISRLHLTLLDSVPSEENMDQLNLIECAPDSFTHINKSIYLYCERPYHQTKLSHHRIEKTLKVKATTRNWKTTLKVLELASQE